MKGEAIPLASRIVTVADAFDALTHDRPYRAATTIKLAIEELRREAGEQFDPQVVEALARVLYQESGFVEDSSMRLPHHTNS